MNSQHILAFIASHGFLLCSRGCTCDCHLFGDSTVSIWPGLLVWDYPLASFRSTLSSCPLQELGSESLVCSLFQDFSVHRARMCYMCLYVTHTFTSLYIRRYQIYLYSDIYVYLYLFINSEEHKFTPTFLMSSPTPKVHACFLISTFTTLFSLCPSESLQPITTHSQCCSFALHKGYLILIHYSVSQGSYLARTSHQSLDWTERRKSLALF